MVKKRVEKDTLGNVSVEIDKFWGAQTQRSLQNFKIGNDIMPIEIIHAMAIIKLSCAKANLKQKSISSKIANNISIPLIVHGGAGKKEHVLDILKSETIDAVCLASMFHYDVIKNHKLNFDNHNEGNFDFLKSGRSVKNIKTASIRELKRFLRENDISLRLKNAE